MTNVAKKTAPATLIQMVVELQAKNMNTTQIIRYLAADSANYERADIARAMGKGYQHVRNVLTQKAKKPAMREATAADLGIEE